MLFFFYGTLTSRERLRLVMDGHRFQDVGEGTVRGTLYDLGAYPGLVLDGDSTIPGIVVDTDDGASAQLDEYEAVTDGLYERRRVAVERSTGGSLVAWTYVYLGPVDDLRAITAWQKRDQPVTEQRSERMVEKSIELTGISANSIEEAVRLAVARAAVTIDSLRKAEVVDVSANLEDGEIVSWRVRTRITFAVQDRLHE